ncbi:MAG: hypothetical protein M0Q95_16355 [Porticoccaceae bacterium]|nr:hypothetical protein [Porticoccaceae bacterium]
MTTSTDDHNFNNVVDLFSGKPYSQRHSHRIIRLAPELDGLEMIYSNQAHPDKFFSIKILCWALRANDEVVGLVPWLNKLTPCCDIQDPLNGKWEGYYDPGIDEVFFDPPIHKIVELESAAEYYEMDWESDEDIVQEIPDTIGTHAVLSSDGFRSILLKEVISWRLQANGNVSGMLVDDDKIVDTPVLPGDNCLFPANSNEAFRYFFQHHIANKIKAQDPEAIAAISSLVES